MNRKTILAAAALVASLPLIARSETHIVNQVGISFDPATLTIQVGDTVQWNWSLGIHTVTNGIDLSDPLVGTLFDAPLDTSNPTFSVTFDTPGDVPYFCRPHISVGMTGLIQVMDATPAPEGLEGGSWTRVKQLYR